MAIFGRYGIERSKAVIIRIKDRAMKIVFLYGLV
jgi:hypothetical protein